MCDSSHILQVYSIVPLGNQAASSTMVKCPTQSHYPNTEPTSPCPMLIMPSARLRSDKYKFLSHWFDLTRVRNHVVNSEYSCLEISAVQYACKSWALPAEEQKAGNDVLLLYNTRPVVYNDLWSVCHLVYVWFMLSCLWESTYKRSFAAYWKE